MNSHIDKIWNYYKGLPWYGKVGGFLLLVVLAILIIVYFFQSLFSNKNIQTEIDEKHTETINVALEEQEAHREMLKGIVKTKKKELAIKLNQMRNIDSDTLKARERIKTTDDLEELIKLQKELGL